MNVWDPEDVTSVHFNPSQDYTAAGPGSSQIPSKAWQMGVDLQSACSNYILCSVLWAICMGVDNVDNVDSLTNYQAWGSLYIRNDIIIAEHRSGYMLSSRFCQIPFPLHWFCRLHVTCLRRKWERPRYWNLASRECIALLRLYLDVICARVYHMKDVQVPEPTGYEYLIKMGAAGFCKLTFILIDWTWPDDFGRSYSATLCLCTFNKAFSNACHRTPWSLTETSRLWALSVRSRYVES